MKFLLPALVMASAAIAAPAAELMVHPFTKSKLSDQFFSEGAAFGDFNHDGKNDVVSGPYWYAAPDFKERHEYYPAKPFDPKNYSDNFFTFTYDFNGDGWADILVLGFPGKTAIWFENPAGKGDRWTPHQVFDGVDNESPTFTDITGDGKPDLICTTGGKLGYATADWKDPAKPWTFHAVSAPGGWQRFTHGIGVGDINGDGKMDLLLQEGWYEQPASLADDKMWSKHAVNFGRGGAQMYAYDVNGDGRNDVITSLAAHEYGLAWYEQNADGTFTQHVIMDSKPEDNAYGLVFSQLHAVDLIDIDGDGLKDIVTGKRYWAHGEHGDKEPNAPAVLYWFRLTREGGKVDFVPYKIDDDSGVGTQVMAGDIDGDGKPDIVVGNKKGTFVFIQKPTKVDKAEWDKAQPQRRADAK